MGFGGGNDAKSPPLIEHRDSQKTDLPLQETLTGGGQRNLNYAMPFSVFGAGHTMLPQVPLGQIFMPGPNPTIFGANPFDYDASYFGGASRHLPPEMQVPTSTAYAQQNQQGNMMQNLGAGLLLSLLTGDTSLLQGMFGGGGGANGAPQPGGMNPGVGAGGPRSMPLHPQTPSSLGGSQPSVPTGGGNNRGGGGQVHPQTPVAPPAPQVAQQPAAPQGPMQVFPGGGGGGLVFSALQQNSNPNNIWWEGYGAQAQAMKDAYMASQNGGNNAAKPA